MEQKYYTVTQAAKILGLSRDTVLEYCHAKGQQFAFKMGKKGWWRIRLDKLRAYIERPRRTRDIYIFNRKEERKFG